MVSCKKTETTATDVNADPNAAAVVVDNGKLPITGDSTVNAVDNGSQDVVNATNNAIKEGANAAGTAIKNGADATGNAVKSGAAEVKEAAHDATDGDGHLTK